MNSNPTGYGELTLKRIRSVSAKELIPQMAGTDRPLQLVLRELPVNAILDDAAVAVEVSVATQSGLYNIMTTQCETKPNIYMLELCALVPNWWYANYMVSEQWARRRAEYFASHPAACHVCSSKEGIQLHHKTYDRMGYEPDSDLVPLCADCHEKVHAYVEGYSRRIGDLFYLWEKMTEGHSGDEQELIKLFIQKYRANLDHVFGCLPPIERRLKMKFISVFRDTARSLGKVRDCLPHHMLAKIINSK